MSSTSGPGAVLISGASTGIGRACALDLAARGHRVFAGIRREKDAISLRQAGEGQITPVFLDVTSAESIEAAAKRLEAELPPEGLLGLVNNAGITQGGLVEYLDLDELRGVLETNFIGAVAMIQAFLPLLRRQKGRIVNMSSIGGRVATPLVSPYNASKFALEALSDALRIELRQSGVSVSLVEPGPIATPIWKKTAAAMPEILERIPAEGWASYGPLVEAIQGRVGQLEGSAIPAQRVADAVRHALTASRPRTRYLVGNDARLRALLRWLLPDRWGDSLMARLLRLPASPGR